MGFGLGRIQAADDRDKSFLMRAATAFVKSEAPYKYWNQSQYWGDQGDLPACVGYAWAHWLKNAPITQKQLKQPDPLRYYMRAQQLDEWEGEDYAGTSVRGGAKALQEMGFVGAYLWAWNVTEIEKAIKSVGPVVVGTNWYYSMFQPQEDGLLEVSGPLAGGHAYLLNGVNSKKELFRIKNSWGRGWGDSGNAWISFEDMQRLLNEEGEACLATELQK